MDDSNGVYTSNAYLRLPQLEDSQYNRDFEEYYKKYLEESRRKAVIKNIENHSKITTDAYDPYDTIPPMLDIELPKRRFDLVKTYVNVDSRDRNKITYPKPNNFKIFLGRTYNNVTEIRLSSVEFPNTNAVINSTNNMIFWRNQEDIEQDIIDNITKTYPVYASNLRIGSYISMSIQNEITSKMTAIKRLNNTGEFHYFIVDLDLDTDIVSVTSLILTQLNIDPIATTAGIGLVTVTAPNHGYINGDTIYIVGSKSTSGIPAAVLDGPHTINVINTSTFQFEVNVKAGETAIGGGNTIKSGRLAPFQFLFGEYKTTIAPNLGYPLENSSQRIDTMIKKMSNIYQVKITLATPGPFANTGVYINQPCVISGTDNAILDGTRSVSRVHDQYTLIVVVNSNLDIPVYGAGTLQFNGTDFQIASVLRNDIKCVLVETFTAHSLTLDDINNTVEFYSTISAPKYDSSNVIFSVLTDVHFIIPGDLLDGGDVNVSIYGDAGGMSRVKPLTTVVKPVSGIIPGALTTVSITGGHNLSVGDKVSIFSEAEQTITTPPLNGILTVNSVLSSTSFTVDTLTNTVDSDLVARGKVFLGYPDVYVSFPYHGFNFIVSVVSIIDTGFNVEIVTQLDHGLATGDTVRISGTDCTPSIDSGYVIKVMSLDTFRIFVPGGISSPGMSGALGISNELYIYGAHEIGGMMPTDINGIKYTVHTVMDEHNFMFKSNTYATRSEQGGGNNIYISSLRHGFSGIQTNTKNSILNRSINLEGENYSFLCCPQLATMQNTGRVENIFARIALDQSPGNVVFSYLSNPKIFDTTPLNKLDELDFSIVNYDNTLYEFNDLDYSFVLEITELKDVSETFHQSSRRGV